MQSTRFSTRLIVAFLSLCVVARADECRISSAADDAKRKMDAAEEADIPTPPKALELVRKHDYQAALPYYRELADKHPTNSGVRYRYGRALISANQRDKAVEELREAVRLSPENAKYHFFLGGALDGVGRIEESEEHFAVALRLAPDNDWYPLQLGNLYTLRCQFDTAIEYFETSLAAKESSQARIGLVLARHHGGDFSASIKDCDVVLRDEPANHLILTCRAFANMRMGNLDEAEHDANRAIKTSDRGSEVDYLTLGAIALLRGKFDVARQQLDESLRLHPRSPALVLRAHVQFKIGNVDATIADLDEAIRLGQNPEGLNRVLDGHGWQVYKFRGFVNLLGKNDAEAAIGDLTQAIALNTGDADCFALRGWANLFRENWKDAHSDLSLALTLAPDHGLATRLLVTLLTTCPDNGLRNGRKALEVSSAACSRTDWKDITFADGLAAAYSAIGDFENATKTQQRVVAMSRRSDPFVSQAINVWWNWTLPLKATVRENDAVKILELYQRREGRHLNSKDTKGPMFRLSSSAGE